MKTKLSIAAGFAVSGLLLWLALRNVPLENLAGAYARVNAWYLLPVALVTVVELFLRGAKWRLLLLPANPGVRVFDAFRLQAAGLALNNVLPLRLGELARASFAASEFKVPLLTVLATILVERLLDVVVLVIMFAAAAAFGGLSGGLLEYRNFLWTLVAALAAGLGALIFADELVSHAWFSGFFARFPRLRSLFEKVAMGVKGFHSFRSGAAILGLASLQWLANATTLWLMAVAFGLGAVVTFFRGIALLFSGAVAASIPAAPGFFGNFELMLTKVMKGWGVEETVGFAYASFAHVSGYILVTVIGVFFIYQMGQSLGKVWGEFSAGVSRGSK
ncbi:MAG TPA: hypothetical protein DEQ38_07720 [Elusimicrobia bacterium]|nr:MAG: hypothetical protein A2089_12015 [Elusimicrobia bacterium GWD2_63_28]HCC47984.1 hypothetical protein [Elusimicrobiota bacterium]